MASLEAMATLVQSVAPEWESAPMLRAETALEELLANSVSHGDAVANATAPDIWLGAALCDERLQLRYEDGFAAFDPMDQIDQALRRTANPLAQRPPGGLGLLMVFRLADGFSYQRVDGRNRIDLAFVRHKPA